MYECRAQAAGQEVVVATKLDIVGHKPLSSCIPRSLQGAAPTITGWLSTIMLQSGDTARLPCHIEGDTGSHSVVWSSVPTPMRARPSQLWLAQWH